MCQCEAAQAAMSVPLPLEQNLVLVELRAVAGAAGGCWVLASLHMVAVVVTGACGDGCGSSRGVMVTRPAAAVGLSGLSGVHSPLPLQMELLWFLKKLLTQLHDSVPSEFLLALN